MITSEKAKQLGFGKWMKGRQMSEEAKEKIRQAMKGGNRTSFRKGSKVGEATQFKNGHMPWLKGKTKLVDERIAKSSGRNHYNWKGGKTAETKKERSKFRVNYAPKVFERDNYTCQKCGARGIALHANHKKTWADYPELRFDLENVETLCWYCHYVETFKKEPTERSIKFGTWKI